MIAIPHFYELLLTLLIKLAGFFNSYFGENKTLFTAIKLMFFILF
jgi:hypothetical protein